MLIPEFYDFPVSAFWLWFEKIQFTLIYRLFYSLE